MVRCRHDVVTALHTEQKAWTTTTDTTAATVTRTAHATADTPRTDLCLWVLRFLASFGFQTHSLSLSPIIIGTKTKRTFTENAHSQVLSGKIWSSAHSKTHAHTKCSLEILFDAGILVAKVRVFRGWIRFPLFFEPPQLFELFDVAFSAKSAYCVAMTIAFALCSLGIL